MSRSRQRTEEKVDVALKLKVKKEGVKRMA